MPITIHNHIIDKLALLSGIISGIALYPQVWIIMHSSSLEHFSGTTFAILFLNSFVWLAYAIHRGLLSLGISAMLNILGSGAVLAKILSVVM